MSDQLCKLLHEVDEYFNDGTVDEKKFKNFTECHSYCPYDSGKLGNCKSNNERINALGEYLYQKLPKNDKEFKDIGIRDNLHIEFFMMWLSDKLFKIDKDYKATLEESYEKHLKNITGNFEYWDALNSKQVYKNATIVRMNKFYNLLNSICKTINELRKNLNNIDVENLKKYADQCLSLYRIIHKSSIECKPYMHLLDSLKTIYAYIKSYKIPDHRSLDNSTKTSLLFSIPSLTTFDYQNKYFIPHYETLSFGDEVCGKVKLKDEEDGKKGPSTDSQSTQGNGVPKKRKTDNQKKLALTPEMLKQLEENRKKLQGRKKPGPQSRPRPQLPSAPAHTTAGKSPHVLPKSPILQQPPANPAHQSQQGQQQSASSGASAPSSDTSSLSGATKSSTQVSGGASTSTTTTPTTTITPGTSTATSTCTTSSPCTTASPGIQNGVSNPINPKGDTSSQQTNQDAKQVNQNGDQGNSGSQGGGPGGGPGGTDTNKEGAGTGKGDPSDALGGKSGVAGGVQGSQVGDPSSGTRDTGSGADGDKGKLSGVSGGLANVQGDSGSGKGSGAGGAIDGAGSGQGDQGKPSDMSGSPVNVQGDSNGGTGHSGNGADSGTNAGAGGAGGITGDGKVSSNGNAGDAGTDQGNSGGGAVSGSGGGQGAQNPASVDPNHAAGSSGGGSKPSGDPNPTHSSGTSNGYWLSNWGTYLNPMSYIPSVSDMYQAQKKIITNATNQVSSVYNITVNTAKDAYDKTVNAAKDAYDKTVNAAKNAYGSAVTAVKNTYDSTMTTVQGAYSATTNYVGGVVGSIANQLNPFGTSSTPGDNQSGSGGTGSGSSTGSNSSSTTQIPNSDPNQILPPSQPLPSSPSPPSLPPNTQPTISQPQPNQTQDPLQSAVQKGGPSPSQRHGANAGTGISQATANSSTGSSNTGNGNTTGIVIKMNEQPSIWCIGPNKKCDLVGISVIGVSISIFLAIMYKYLSFGQAKNSKKGKNMKRVINSTSGKRQIQIIINSSTKKKQTKKSIKPVYREKYPLLNIYKLMQADPMPFINLFFLLIFFVYKRKRDTIE
ncbi:Plasmodium variant antigen protein Cir/Yir/Bir, putative [Plasmodium chabaudi adami]|uniref:Plasmodium variant antigen protein Cir/Yir/Bir, putative n=1 Tax=Plasmodium chabaudi adami TaxID=5826 RepID=A0A1C6WUP0_PLACE|nr:Plasmodium variant antigen protein Cir/Yir/Bir, putative [Plasmodium chabaudi adami]